MVYQRSPLPARRPVRRGVSSVLAMLYLVLFATLAIGFYAATTTAVQVSGNEQRTLRAQLAAESGMEFMRYHLGTLRMPPGTKPEESFDALYNCLVASLQDTLNLGSGSIGVSGNTISIPADANQYIAIDPDSHQSFRVTITDWAGEIVVKVTGRYATPAMLSSGSAVYRTITMEFTRQNRPMEAFTYAVSSRGQVVITRGGILSADPYNPNQASVMSASATNGSINMSGGEVSGNLNIVEDATAVVTGGKVAGTSNTAIIYQDHIKVVATPDFPVADTSVFKPYAVNTYDPSKKTQQNIRIPPNTNPKFTGNDTVQGIMYIEAPNIVEFRGSFNLHGFIVAEEGGPSSTTLDFRGNVTQLPLPSGDEFDALRVTTGISILAPDADVIMSGSSESHLIGNVMIGKFSFNGAGTINIERGTLMTFRPGNNAAIFSGKDVKFSATGAGNLPSPGLYYSTHYLPKPNSYQEVLP